MTANESTQGDRTGQSGERPTRRRLLVSVGGASLVAVAGCLGGGDGNGGDDNGTDSNGAAATGDDSTGGANGETDNATDDTTENGTDDSTNNDTDNSTDEDTDSGNDSDSTDGGDGNGTDDSSDPTLSEVYQWDNSYVMEFTGPDATGTVVYHEGDVHITITSQGQESEFYLVDDSAYSVTGGQCVEIQNLNPEENVPVDAPDPGNYGDLTPSGTRTHDGQEVYVYEVTEGEMLVSVSSGYPVQYTSGTGNVVEFHSWGETDPISPPDMECQSY